MARVWKSSKHKGNELLTLLAIADNANDDGYAFPGIEHIAQKVRMSERTAMRMIDAISASGELLAVRRRNKGNLYMVLCGCSEEERAARIGRMQPLIDKVSDKSKSISDKMSYASDIAMSHDPSNNHQNNHHKRQPDLLYERVYFWVSGKEYISGQSESLGLVNRICKLLRDISAAPDEVDNYYRPLVSKGLTPARDGAKVQAGIIAARGTGRADQQITNPEMKVYR